MVIGKGGQSIEELKVELKEVVKDKFVLINIVEVKTPENDAQ